MTAYYNEYDLYAAAWLRNLIADGHIADGVVDTRSIEDVRPNDLRGFAQCHFFAGIGVWSLALRRAGWPDDRPVWTGSCPCQPFSQAGDGAGFADERHLWPAFGHLIKERKPELILGEQVASKDVDPWIDLVQADLEALGYAFGSVPYPSAGVGAPHIRDRNYWAAVVGVCLSDAADCGRREECTDAGRIGGGDSAQGNAAGSLRCGPVVGLGHADVPQQNVGRTSGGEQSICDEDRTTREGDGAGPTNGFWRDADWLGCTDGKWRPVESGTFPLADGIANRMGKLRAYGNAINAEQARIWIETVMECMP